MAQHELLPRCVAGRILLEQPWPASRWQHQRVHCWLMRQGTTRGQPWLACRTLNQCVGFADWLLFAFGQKSANTLSWAWALLCLADVCPGCLRFQTVSFRHDLLRSQRTRAVEPHRQWGVLGCQGQTSANSQLSRLCTCDCCAQAWAAARNFQELPRVLPTRLKPFGAWKLCKEVAQLRAHSWSRKNADWRAQQGVQFHGDLLACREDFFFDAVRLGQAYIHLISFSTIIL